MNVGLWIDLAVTCIHRWSASRKLGQIGLALARFGSRRCRDQPDVGHDEAMSSPQRRLAPAAGRPITGQTAGIFTISHSLLPKSQGTVR